LLGLASRHIDGQCENRNRGEGAHQSHAAVKYSPQ
jgi:hypothetical protein